MQNPFENHERHRPSRIKLLRMSIWIVAIFGSLLTFPASISWMLAFWLAWVGVSLRSGSTAWPALAICLIVLVIKNPSHSFSLLALHVVGIALIATMIGRRSIRTTNVCYALLWVVFVWFVATRWSESVCSRQLTLDPNRCVVCLGDSLTDAGYPQELEPMISVPVADFGNNGFTITDAIKKLLPEIEALRPQVVIVELGGHDYKDGRTRDETRNGLATIIERLQAIDAQVILVEIPRGFIRDPYAGLERELCGSYDLQLIPDTLIRRFIFFSPIVPPGNWLGESSWLSADGLHPNPRGNRLFAQYAKSALVKLYGASVLADSN